MWFYQIKVLPSYQAVVFKNNSYFKTLETGSHSIFAGLFNNSSFFTILLPKNSQILSIKNISLLSYQNFTYKISFAVEYTILNTEQFCKSFNVVQISQDGYRMPLDDFETKLELRSKSLFMRHGKMISLADFATDIDLKFSQILQELNDIYNDMGVQINSLNITNIETGSLIGNFKNTLEYNSTQLTLETTQEDKENTEKNEAETLKTKNKETQKTEKKSEKKTEKKELNKPNQSSIKTFLF